jgi:PREDICTED: similar to CG6024-PA
MKERFRSLSRQIDGAVIISSGEENMNCTLTFQTETVLQRFMLKFEELKLDCHDHLYLFDGDIPTDKSKVYF